MKTEISKNARLRPIILMICLVGNTSVLAQEIEVRATPHNPPLLIQPTGGNFDYEIAVTNNEGAPLQFDVWTYALAPDHRQTPPIVGPHRVLLPGGWTASKALAQAVPQWAPSGLYSYVVAVGLHPGDIWDSDQFEFEKLHTGGGWYAQATNERSYMTSVHFVDEENGWVAGITNSILRTTDGGDNWYSLDPPPSVNYYDIFFVDQFQGWAVGTPGKIQHTTDGGDHWEFQESGTTSAIYGLHFTDPHHGWVVGGKERSFTPPTRFIIHTSDGGQTWGPQLSDWDEIPLRDVFFVDALNGWAIGDGVTILVTHDGGANWVQQNAPVSANVSSVFFADQLHGWIVGQAGLLLATIDGGENWFIQDPRINTSLADVHFIDPDRGWAVGGDAMGSLILYSGDGGTSWQVQEEGSFDFLSAITFVGDEQGWAVGNIGTVVHTETGGF